jgi:catechol 2,3-dioxygenase-like lactoylglutathione lyase family enzyme
VVSTDLHAVSMAAHDPALLARFWAGVLRREIVDGPVGPELLPDGDPAFLIRFFRTDQEKQGPNQTHFDLTSTSLDDQQAIVDRALGLGGRYLDIGQSPDEDHVVLADPEGNELCVVGPDNRFLADTAPIGCLSSDGLRDVGVFWSEALGWPLVWDQDTETAIQSPRGGSKVSWGGDPVNPKLGPNRLHLDLSPTADSDQDSEVERLVGLGAVRLDVDHPIALGHGVLPVVVLADPGGNELCVLPS